MSFIGYVRNIAYALHYFFLLAKDMTCLLIQLKKHLVTASYVDDSMSFLHEEAKAADITILGEMGLDPGIGNFHYKENHVLHCYYISHFP
jgi:alpha-aminoadipic semialdehyde synthase